MSDLKKRYECLNCKSVITLRVEQDENKIKCCDKPDLKILSSEYEEEPQIVLGKCYEEIINIIENYMDMPKESIKLVAIWIIGTYFHMAFSTYPFLFINAMRGSGKTRLLKIISHLSKRGKGEVQTGIKESVLFRMPKGETLVLDELEDISKEKTTLREYLNASYKVGGIVQRMKKVKDEWVTETFRPYKPIAMANIWGMDEVLGDRCISFILEKSSNPAKTKKIEDFEENPRFKELTELLNKISVVNVVKCRQRRYKEAWNCYVDKKHNYILTQTTKTP